MGRESEKKTRSTQLSKRALVDKLENWSGKEDEITSNRNEWDKLPEPHTISTTIQLARLLLIECIVHNSFGVKCI